MNAFRPDSHVANFASAVIAQTMKIITMSHKFRKKIYQVAHVKKVDAKKIIVSVIRKVFFFFRQKVWPHL